MSIGVQPIDEGRADPPREPSPRRSAEHGSPATLPILGRVKQERRSLMNAPQSWWFTQTINEAQLPATCLLPPNGLFSPGALIDHPQLQLLASRDTILNQ